TVSASKSEATPRSCGLIFTCGKMKIATSPLFYKGATLFMPEKMGNLQHFSCLYALSKGALVFRHMGNDRSSFDADELLEARGCS
ncbi:MAG: hypothetical protein IKJ37_09900, partial [Kiritimatiellae bacterium]|nr:hypothetical protein [Kiritimatiellia bacterium]